MSIDLYKLNTLSDKMAWYISGYKDLVSRWSQAHSRHCAGWTEKKSGGTMRHGTTGQ